MTGETGNSAEPIPIEFFFDYICPFCYVGDARLRDVVARYPVAVHYRFIEIHPDNPSEGRPLEALGYDPARWQQMQTALDDMIREDRLPWRERRFTTNSRRAILLAQTVLNERPAAFMALHRALFHAYFADGRNIGDPEVLADIARSHGVEDLLDTAWNTPEPMQRFLEHVEAAQRMRLTGVPTLVVGERAFPGAVSVETLEAALRQHGDDAEAPR